MDGISDREGGDDGTAQYLLAGSLKGSHLTATFPGCQFLGGTLGVKLPGSIAVEGISSLRRFLPVSMPGTQPDHATGGLREGP